MTLIRAVAVAVLLPSFLLHAQDPDSLAGEAGGDSLAYVAQREAIRSPGAYPEEYEAYFIAADALAADGMYAEARELLVDLFAGLIGTDEDTVLAGHAGEYPDFEMPDTSFQVPGPAITSVPDSGADSTSQPPGKAQRRKRVTLRSVAALSYDRYDNAYLTSTRGDTLDSIYARLDEIDEQPLNGYGRASLEWNNEIDYLQRFATFLYGSNTRARAGASAKGQAAGAFLIYDADLELEKRIGEEYGDSSDAAKGGARLEFTTRPIQGPLVFSFPLRLEAEQYRSDRPQYISYGELSVLPELTLESRDFSRRISGAMEYARRKHGDLDAVDDEVRYGPRLSAEYWGGMLSGIFEGSFVWERYPFRHDPGRSHQLDIALRPSLRLVDWLEAGIEAEGFWEEQGFRDQTLFAKAFDSLLLVTTFRDTVGAYNLAGFGADIRPSLRLLLPLDLSVGIGLLYERGYYPEKTWFGSLRLLDTLYISESYEAYEPGVSLQIDKASLYGAIGLAYRREDIRSDRFLDDFSAWKPRVELTWRIRSWLTLDLYGDYQRRRYTGGEIENSVSASGSLGVKM